MSAPLPTCVAATAPGSSSSAPNSTAWSRTLKRLRETCPEYVERRASCYLRGPSTDARPVRAVKLERVLQRLTQLLETEPGLDLEAEPSTDVLDKVREALAQGLFGGNLCELHRVLRSFRTLPLHPALLACLLTSPALNPPERALLRSIRQRTPCDVRTLRVSLQHLRREQQEQREEQPDVESEQKESLATLGDLSAERAARFCVPTSQVCLARVLLLVLCGCRLQEPQLLVLARRFAQLRAEGVRLSKLLALPLTTGPPAFLALHRRLAGVTWLQDEAFAPNFAPTWLQATSTSEVLEALKGLPALSTRMCLHLAQQVARHELVHALTGRPDPGGGAPAPPAPRNQLERFGAQSPWHQRIVQELVERERDNLHSAFPERHLEMVLKRFARFALALEQRAREALEGRAAWLEEGEVASSARGAAEPSVGPSTEPSLRTFLRTASAQTLTLALRDMLRELRARNERVKSQVRQHHAALCATFFLRFLKGAPLRRHLGCAQQFAREVKLRSLLENLPNQRVARPASERRTFHDDEVERMLRVARNPCELLALTLLREVGLRNSALAHLTYATLLDPHTHEARSECSVSEKGNRPRSFPCGPNLRAVARECGAFVRGLLAGRDQVQLHACYLLHAADPSRPLHTNALGKLLRRVARDAGVTGVKVHAHAFRHTLVTKLFLAGNPLELVSRFLGHQDTASTSYFYLQPTPEDVARALKDPFAKRAEGATLQSAATEQTEPSEERQLLVAAQQALLAQRRILDSLLETAPTERKLQLQQQLPDYGRVLQAVARLPDFAPVEQPCVASMADFE